MTGIKCEGTHNSQSLVLTKDQVSPCHLAETHTLRMTKVPGASATNLRPAGLLGAGKRGQGASGQDVGRLASTVGAEDSEQQTLGEEAAGRNGP